MKSYDVIHSNEISLEELVLFNLFIHTPLDHVSLLQNKIFIAVYRFLLWKYAWSLSKKPEKTFFL